MKGIIVEVVRVSMCRFRFKLYQAVVQRCRMICFKFMYWLRLGAVVPLWFCISSILQYQSQFGTNWLNRCIVPFLRHSADASLWGRLSLRQAGSSFQAVMHEHSPQGLFRRRPLKLVDVVEHRERRSAGSPSSHSKVPSWLLHEQGSEEGWAKAEKERARPCTASRGGIHQGLHQFTSRWSFEHPFLVVSGSQGIGKSTMLNNLMCEHVKNGKRVLPLKMSSRPGEDLKLNEALPKALQAVNLSRYYPEQVEYMLEKVNETCKPRKRRTGSAVVVCLQLTTKSRGNKFSRDACDDIASTLGAFARNITYDNATCKFILEVSVSAVADIITERFNMSDLVVVRPLPFEDFTSVVKEVAKQGNDFRTLNKVLADDEIEEVLKHYYIRTGRNFRALGEILRNVSRAGQKGADAVIKRVEQWYKRRVEPIQRKLDDQEVKDYLLKVAGAGPMGYLPESDEDTKMALKLLREEPADCVLRSTTSETVALKHWHFVTKLFQEDEQKLRDAGYMWASPVKKNCDAWDVLWVSHPRVIFTYCLQNRRYPTLVSMIPRYQY